MKRSLYAFAHMRRLLKAIDEKSATWPGDSRANLRATAQRCALVINGFICQGGAADAGWGRGGNSYPARLCNVLVPTFSFCCSRVLLIGVVIRTGNCNPFHCTLGHLVLDVMRSFLIWLVPWHPFCHLGVGLIKTDAVRACVDLCPFMKRVTPYWFLAILHQSCSPRQGAQKITL